MAENKTRPTEASVEDYIASRANEEQKADCKSLMTIFKTLTTQQPRMWGPSIVGYGSYRYTYESGRSGEMPLAASAWLKQRTAATQPNSSLEDWLYGVIPANRILPLATCFTPHPGRTNFECRPVQHAGSASNAHATAGRFVHRPRRHSSRPLRWATR